MLQGRTRNLDVDSLIGMTVKKGGERIGLRLLEQILPAIAVPLTRYLGDSAKIMYYLFQVSYLPLDRKLVSVRFDGLGFCFPTFNFSFLKSFFFSAFFFALEPISNVHQAHTLKDSLG